MSSVVFDTDDVKKLSLVELGSGDEAGFRHRISFNMDPVLLILLRASLCVQSSQLALLIDLTSNPSTIPAVAALLFGVTYGIDNSNV